MKHRCGPDGLHIFDRRTGLNLLFDELHLALVFGICHNSAARYAAAAEHLLTGELEHPPTQ